MQRSAIMLIVSGVLIVTGLVLLVVGNQIILKNVIQGNEMISVSQDLRISSEFSEFGYGVFAVQIMEFREDTFSLRVLDHLGTEIIYEMIQSGSIEKEFEIENAGSYELIVQSNSDEETQVFGAIGPLPDAREKSLGYLSLYTLVAGMAGLVVSGIYRVRKRKSV